MSGTVLITGASTGIGFEFAKIFAAKGYGVVLVAKNKERLDRAAADLKKLTKYSISTILCDLADPRAPEKLYQDTKAQGLAIDVLVNNAGYGDFGKFLETDLTKELQMIQLNVTALVHLTKLFVRDMKKRGSGKILNVASTAAFQPGPFMAIYYATKAFVLSFSEAINNELKGTGINVTTLCPGPTASNFTKAANMEGNKLFKSGVMDAEAVANQGVNALFAAKSVIIPGARNRLLANSVRFFPRDLVTHFSRKAVEMN